MRTCDSGTVIVVAPHSSHSFFVTFTKRAIELDICSKHAQRCIAAVTEQITGGVHESMHARRVQKYAYIITQVHT